MYGGNIVKLDAKLPEILNYRKTRGEIRKDWNK